MKYSNIALKILACRECGIIKTNAQFWKDFSDIKKLEDKIIDNSNIAKTLDRLSNEFDSSDYEGGFVCIYDDEFPVISKKVKNNSDKPYLLFYKGDLSLLEDLNKNVAVIGLIDPDEEIIKREVKIVQELVSNELVIVSGLAKGCDTIAHKACLEADGKTIAILPTQINKIYPAENRELAEEIVNKGGLLLSEYYKEPMGRNDSINRFVERDRLQAMFAKAIILTASYRKGEGDSGSRHAMEAAKTYGIARYVMYNSKTDETNKRFGLSRDLIDSKDKGRVEILVAKSIKDITEINNQDLIENQESACAQQTLDMLIEYSARYVFDLDNTLIYTDLLNNNSYNYALNKLELSSINDCVRITRDVVFMKYPHLNNEQKEEIVKLKQEYFVNNLQITKINISAFEVLKSQKPEYCILWTSADTTRVQALLSHHKINDAFKEVLYSDKSDVLQDIKKICSLYKCTSEQLTFYEDNQDIIKKLQQLNLKTISV